MFSLPRDTVDVPIPPGPARSVFGSRLPRARSTAGSRRSATAPTSIPGRASHARLQRPQGHPRQPLRARHQVLRRGQLRGLHEGRRRARRRDRSTSRSRSRRPAIPAIAGRLAAGLHPGRHPAHDRRCRRSATRARATRSNDFDRGPRQQRRPRSRSASRPTRRSLIPQLTDLVDRVEVRRPHRHPGRASSATARARRRRSTRRTSARTSSRRRSTHDGVPNSSRGYIIMPERRQDPRRRSANAFNDQPRGRGQAREARPARAPRSGSSTGSARPARPRTSPATSSTRASRHRPRSQKPPRAASRPTRRSWSTTAPRQVRRRRSRTCRRASG